MPVNFPLGQDARSQGDPGRKGTVDHRGDESRQLEAVVDLLLNYDRYMKEQYSIKPLIQAADPCRPATGE